MAVKIVVLSDGETWDVAENVNIVTLSDSAYESLESGEKTLNNLTPNNGVIDWKKVDTESVSR